MIAKESNNFKDIIVLERSKGFCPFSGVKAGLKTIFRGNLSEIVRSNGNILDFYSLHLFHMVAKDDELKLLDDYKWLSLSNTVAAHFIRKVLPNGFNVKHLNTESCILMPNDILMH